MEMDLYLSLYWLGFKRERTLSYCKMNYSRDLVDRKENLKNGFSFWDKGKAFAFFSQAYLCFICFIIEYDEWVLFIINFSQPYNVGSKVVRTFENDLKNMFFVLGLFFGVIVIELWHCPLNFAFLYLIH